MSLIERFLGVILADAWASEEPSAVNGKSLRFPTQATEKLRAFHHSTRPWQVALHRSELTLFLFTISR
jgi:hypothetical protein